MPLFGIFPLVRDTDALIPIELVPPVSVAGWATTFEVSRNIGGNAFVNKYAASGYVGGQSGIAVTDASTGKFAIRFNARDMSGQDPGGYGFKFSRLDSGYVTVLVDGFVNLTVA